MLVTLIRSGCRVVQVKQTVDVHRLEPFRLFRSQARNAESKFTQKPVTLREKILRPATDTRKSCETSLSKKNVNFHGLSC